MKKSPMVLLKEPIDYPALEKAFEMAQWRWYVHATQGVPEVPQHLLRQDLPEFPSAERIKITVERLKKEAGETGDIGTGGITVKKGKVFIHARLWDALEISNA